MVCLSLILIMPRVEYKFDLYTLMLLEVVYSIKTDLCNSLP